VFGGGLVLPLGVVCKTCNEKLNTEVDLPLRDTFHVFLNLLGIGSSKRDSASPVAVGAVTETGDLIPAWLPRVGRLFTPPVRRTNHDQPDGLESYRYADRKTLERHATEMSARKMVPAGEPEVFKVTNLIYSEVELDYRALERATAKAALNLLALRAPELAASDALLPVRRFVRYDEGECSLPVHPVGEVDTSALQPLHSIGVGSDDGTDFTGTLLLFGGILHGVTFHGAWDGEPKHFGEDFDAIARTSTPFA